MDVIKKLLDKARQVSGDPGFSEDAETVLALANELENALHKLEIAEAKYTLEHNRATGWFESYNRQRNQKVELLGLIRQIERLLNEDEDDRTKDLRRSILDTIVTGLSGEAMSNNTESVPVIPE